MNRRTSISVAFSALLALGLITTPDTALAKKKEKYAAIVISSDTGEVLFSRNADHKRHPASLTKMMTLYMLFEQLEAGKIKMDTKMKVSSHAASMPASKLYLKKGKTITVEEAINALVIKSANDVAVVVAEHLHKSERNFARKMTDRARRLGMRKTTFRNASGLHDKKQITTARDMAILSKRVHQDFPQYYHFFNKRSFKYDGKTYHTHNRVLKSLKGADGLKTGYTRKSGYNLATTTLRGNNRMIGIVLGGRSGKTRNAHMEEIINKVYKRVDAKPTLIAAKHRNTPEPMLKPSVLEQLGGVWPTLEMQEEYHRQQMLKEMGEENVILGAVDENAPNMGNAAAMQLALSNSAAQFEGESLQGDVFQEPKSIAELTAENQYSTADLNAVSLASAQYDNDVVLVGEGATTKISRAQAWSIQFGAYRSKSIADKKLKSTKEVLGDIVKGGTFETSETKRNRRTYHRLRVVYLTESQAEQACAAIIKSKGECFAMRDRAISDVN